MYSSGTPVHQWQLPQYRSRMSLGFGELRPQCGQVKNLVSNGFSTGKRLSRVSEN